MDCKRKILLYRSVHRGCKETDLLLGKFAQQNIDLLTDHELLEYEQIVDMDDHKLYVMLTSGKTFGNLVDKIIQFNCNNLY